MEIDGQIILSGVDDDGLIILLQSKKRFSQFSFNPATMKKVGTIDSADAKRNSEGVLRRYYCDLEGSRRDEVH